MRNIHLTTWKMTKSLKYVKNEKCTLKDLEYGEKTENHGKWEIHTLGREIWRQFILQCWYRGHKVTSLLQRRDSMLQLQTHNISLIRSKIECVNSHHPKQAFLPVGLDFCSSRGFCWAKILLQFQRADDNNFPILCTAGFFPSFPDPLKKHLGNCRPR
jgi:hypothetical protein